MHDYISRQAVIQLALDGKIISTDMEKFVRDFINEIPAADVQPVKRGKWILIDNDTVHGKCSECGFECRYYEDDVFGMPFCPNCGAVMREEE